MRIYLAGPMRGIPYYNFPEFDLVRNILRASGHEVVSPADIDRQFGFDAMALPQDYDWTQEPDGLVLKDVVARDLRALQNCEGIYMMKGWEKSKGARAERAVAEWLCLKVIEGSPG